MVLVMLFEVVVCFSDICSWRLIMNFWLFFCLCVYMLWWLKMVRLVRMILLRKFMFLVYGGDFRVCFLVFLGVCDGEGVVGGGYIVYVDCLDVGLYSEGVGYGGGEVLLCFGDFFVLVVFVM